MLKIPLKKSNRLLILKISKRFKLAVFEKNETTIFDDETTSLAHISTYRTLIGELTRLKRQRKETQEGLLPFWLNMEKALMNQSIAPLAKQSFRKFNASKYS